MNTLIIYDSVFGNTERIARAIAGQLEPARLLRVEEAEMLDRLVCDLLIVAGPTHRQKMRPALRAWLKHLPRKTLKEVPVATFDTRYRMSRFLTGSAAIQIASLLRRAEAWLVVPPESFFMERERPPQGEKRRHAMERLEPDEERRAVAWAADILERLEAARQQTKPPGRLKK